MGKKQIKKNSLITTGIAAQNRKARHDYDIGEKFEAGLVLKGPEVKSLRLGRATIADAYAMEREGELWLLNSYIPPYQGGVLSYFDSKAPRKLLLHKKQLRQLFGEISKAGASLIPLDFHFNEKGRAKVTLGVAKGRKKVDKRHALAERDWKRDKARLLRNSAKEF
ncbi:SsrA-binding protein SmpB [Acetobacteraceae bacterium]|nr:SsrA-binding protein SmpB [Acetobacteraceae bacterium]